MQEFHFQNLFYIVCPKCQLLSVTTIPNCFKYSANSSTYFVLYSDLLQRSSKKVLAFSPLFSCGNESSSAPSRPKKSRSLGQPSLIHFYISYICFFFYFFYFPFFLSFLYFLLFLIYSFLFTFCFVMFFLVFFRVFFFFFFLFFFS